MRTARSRARLSGRSQHATGRFCRVVVTTVTLLIATGCRTAPGPDAAGSSALPAGGPRPSWVTHPSLQRCPTAAPTARAELPSTTLRCLGAGPALALAQLPARPYIVNLWASWCIPCQREASRFAAAVTAAHGTVDFLGVDTEDERGSALDFLHHFALDYPQLADPNGDVLHRLPEPGLPVTLAVDAAGRVVYRRIGEISAAQLAAALHAANPQLPAIALSSPGQR